MVGFPIFSHIYIAMWPFVILPYCDILVSRTGVISGMFAFNTVILYLTMIIQGITSYYGYYNNNYIIIK